MSLVSEMECVGVGCLGAGGSIVVVSWEKLQYLLLQEEMKCLREVIPEVRNENFALRSI